MAHEAEIRIATRAGELAGLTAPQARACALMAVAEHLLERAEAREQSAAWADTRAQREADGQQARRLRATADELQRQARELTDGL